ncbi:hypothetical protein POVWA2_032300 [Plasmodium ovale wallikeri]|uniref:Uncharacterized protein n=1 Tax=Plasmodium ovale wallikeri TaxID=864142 RepID=A0A1A8YY21_PLAOA|nr:hypothetical protein POVWA1_032670 [Plasmodium ovale wallikeri]SBT36879.1 hypothetical protein POVWA2_032300 [Plasmodium ovale wallikeri]
MLTTPPLRSFPVSPLVHPYSIPEAHINCKHKVVRGLKKKGSENFFFEKSVIRKKGKKRHPFDKTRFRLSRFGASVYRRGNDGSQRPICASLRM